MSKPILVIYRELGEAQPYALAIEAAGLQARLEQARPGLAIGDSAGLLLTGGTDVDPARYGEVAGPETEAPDAERDEAESVLIDEALARDLPLLGICRGLQMLNVQLGGTLVQHLPNAQAHVRRTPDRGAPAHQVAIEPGTLLAKIAGRETWDVNSRHHQAVKQLGAGLRACARDTGDGTIEAIELPGYRYVLAVQWHPENQSPKDPEQQKLFRSFAGAM